MLRYGQIHPHVASSFLRIFISFALFAVNVKIIYWVMNASLNTLILLQAKQHVQKVQMYKSFISIFKLGAVTGVAIVIATEIYFQQGIAYRCFRKVWWVEVGMCETQFILCLLCLAFYWRPNDMSKSTYIPVSMREEDMALSNVISVDSAVYYEDDDDRTVPVFSIAE